MEAPPEIRAALERVFPSVEGIAGGRFPDWKPGPDMEGCGLLHLDGPYPILSETQCIAVAKAASRLADEGCYLSYVERYDGPGPVQDFELEGLSFGSYLDLQDPAVFSHIVVSQRGRWGVFVDSDGVAVVAGPTSFIADVYRTLPSTHEQAIRFAAAILATGQSGLIEWLTELLAGVLGAEEAAAVLSAADAS